MEYAGLSCSIIILSVFVLVMVFMNFFLLLKKDKFIDELEEQVDEFRTKWLVEEYKNYKIDEKQENIEYEMESSKSSLELSYKKLNDALNDIPNSKIIEFKEIGNEEFFNLVKKAEELDYLSHIFDIDDKISPSNVLYRITGILCGGEFINTSNDPEDEWEVYKGKIIFKYGDRYYLITYYD